MSLQYIQFIFLVAVTCLTVSNAQTIQCYQCQTIETSIDRPDLIDHRCRAESFNPLVGTTDCTTYGSCALITMTAPGQMTSYIRHCFDDAHFTVGCTSWNGTNICYYRCSTNLCNGSVGQSNGSTAFMYTLSVMLTLMISTLLKTAFQSKLQLWNTAKWSEWLGLRFNIAQERINSTSFKTEHNFLK